VLIPTFPGAGLAGCGCHDKIDRNLKKDTDGLEPVEASGGFTAFPGVYDGRQLISQ
jgi:hypothetical protein